ncbi:MAG: hypothetical protein AB7P76_01055 [Candidatus Melainabacteria bacterium]
MTIATLNPSFGCAPAPAPRFGAASADSEAGDQYGEAVQAVPEERQAAARQAVRQLSLGDQRRVIRLLNLGVRDHLRLMKALPGLIAGQSTLKDIPVLKSISDAFENAVLSPDSLKRHLGLEGEADQLAGALADPGQRKAMAAQLGLDSPAVATREDILQAYALQVAADVLETTRNRRPEPGELEALAQGPVRPFISDLTDLLKQKLGLTSGENLDTVA